jgi:hypothetical protein
MKYLLKVNKIKITPRKKRKKIIVELKNSELLKKYNKSNAFPNKILIDVPKQPVHME